jgi:hypothetical protein
MHLLKCERCSLEFTRGRRPNFSKVYCSKTCANRNRPRRKRKYHCKLCGGDVLTGRKFCKPCRGKARPKRSEMDLRLQMNGWVKNHHRRLKYMSVELLGSCCLLCGYSRCIAALEFHHIDPDQKGFTLSGRSISWERYRTEVLKCILLCANCHREVEARTTALPPYLFGACVSIDRSNPLPIESPAFSLARHTT